MKAAVFVMLFITTVYCLPVKRSASSSESSEEHVVAQRPIQILRKAAANLEEPTQALPAESNESTDSEDDTQETISSESDSEETYTTSSPPTWEPTLDPIINTGRGDSLGYPGDYKKSIVYVDAKDFEKLPSPYKSYSGNKKVGGLTIVNKKMTAYNGQYINDVEKEMTLYKALQVHDGLLEEDTSTPEMEAALGDEIVPEGNQYSDGANAGDSSSASASASQEETEKADSTATPVSADSDSDSSQSTESQESEEHTTEATVVIAK